MPDVSNDRGSEGAPSIEQIAQCSHVKAARRPKLLR